MFLILIPVTILLLLLLYCTCMLEIQIILFFSWNVNNNAGVGARGENMVVNMLPLLITLFGNLSYVCCLLTTVNNLERQHQYQQQCYIRAPSVNERCTLCCCIVYTFSINNVKGYSNINVNGDGNNNFTISVAVVVSNSGHSCCCSCWPSKINYFCN